MHSQSHCKSEVKCVVHTSLITEAAQKIRSQKKTRTEPKPPHIAYAEATKTKSNTQQPTKLQSVLETAAKMIIQMSEIVKEMSKHKEAKKPTLKSLPGTPTELDTKNTN